MTDHGRDDGIERETRAPKPCCTRLADGNFCLGPSGHGDTVFCGNPKEVMPDRLPLSASKEARDAEAAEEEARIKVIRDGIHAKYTKGIQK